MNRISLKVPTQETDKSKISNNNLSTSPYGLETLASMKESEKRNGDHGMYSHDNLSTHAEPTLRSLCQSELFTRLTQEAKGNMRLEPRDHKMSHQRNKRKKQN
jgi:hypothetical protein